MSEILSINLKDKHSAIPKTRLVGDAGEKLAARFLVKNGYRLILANFKIPIGRNSRGAAVTGEIDLIALDGEILCFVEVKTRSSDEFAAPLAAVDRSKQRQITRTARIYRKVFNLRETRFRYDVVSVVLPKNTEPKIELFKNFWNEAKFRKRSWSDEF